jgi:hypothetical protein
MQPDPCTKAMPTLQVVGTAGSDHGVACYFPTLYGAAGDTPASA